MMQSQFLHHQHSWPIYETATTYDDHHLQMDADLIDITENELSFSFSTTEVDSPDQFLSTIFAADCDHFGESTLYADDEFQFSPPMEENFVETFLIEESISSQQFPIFVEESENVWSPSLSTKSSEVSSIGFPSLQQHPLAFPEINSQEGLKHLLIAHGEAVWKEQMALAEVTAKCLSEKVSPDGETLERIGFSLCQSSGKQGEYLMQESIKNYEAAREVFCQIFPFQKFAHFTANSAILEAVPENAKTVHIVDFDIREGVQWPSMIEAIARRGKSLKITSIKIEEEHPEAHLVPSFEETKRRLCVHARSFGLNLKMEEICIEDFKKRVEETEWLAFNCMVGLPHMGRRRSSRAKVMEFLKMGKEIVSGSGVIVMGDGDASEGLKTCSGYNSFFEGYLNHYQALCESMEWHFPDSFAEARIALEALFVTPLVSATYWQQKWEEVRGSCDFASELGLKGVRFSQENVMEAKEIVREKESSYAVRIEGQDQNEMVLMWRGTPLVKVSTWR